ncbi:hypothetical protein CDD81_1206 [Ophiocordyceps australis]|uniref:Uncharacterized protein n=1 Tax=Ophiocordyceps australis TaxID=1399860 RepID=A0A2C5YAW0_9HYPO|nr:hypothetical protein CDD81_1206 [Ophiocordyceps australis]
MPRWAADGTGYRTGYGAWRESTEQAMAGSCVVRSSSGAIRPWPVCDMAAYLEQSVHVHWHGQETAAALITTGHGFIETQDIGWPLGHLMTTLSILFLSIRTREFDGFGGGGWGIFAPIAPTGQLLHPLSPGTYEVLVGTFALLGALPWGHVWPGTTWPSTTWPSTPGTACLALAQRVWRYSCFAVHASLIGLVWLLVLAPMCRDMHAGTRRILPRAHSQSHLAPGNVHGDEYRGLDCTPCSPSRGPEKALWPVSPD